MESETLEAVKWFEKDVGSWKGGEGVVRSIHGEESAPIKPQDVSGNGVLVRFENVAAPVLESYGAVKWCWI